MKIQNNKIVHLKFLTLDIINQNLINKIDLFLNKKITILEFQHKKVKIHPCSRILTEKMV